MATGYTGTYRALVVSDQDPLGEKRLQVQVPEVFLDQSVWARPSLPPGEVGALPAVGDVVWVSFEAGDSDYPVWEHDPSTVLPPAYGQGFGGKYRGLVVDNLDPMQAYRLLVRVPEVGYDEMWAAPDPGLSVSEVPAVGAEVWIEFESGDVSYPRWVGVG
jgi:hypothetical protein